jgi:hypothetical protein
MTCTMDRGTWDSSLSWRTLKMVELREAEWAWEKTSSLPGALVLKTAPELPERARAPLLFRLMPPAPVLADSPPPSAMLMPPAAELTLMPLSLTVRELPPSPPAPLPPLRTATAPPLAPALPLPPARLTLPPSAPPLWAPPCTATPAAGARASLLPPAATTMLPAPPPLLPALPVRITMLPLPPPPAPAPPSAVAMYTEPELGARWLALRVAAAPLSRCRSPPCSSAASAALAEASSSWEGRRSTVRAPAAMVTSAPEAGGWEAGAPAAAGRAGPCCPGWLAPAVMLTLPACPFTASPVLSSRSPEAVLAALAPLLLLAGATCPVPMATAPLAVAPGAE